MQDDVVCEIASHLDVRSILRLLQTSKELWLLRHKPMIQDRILPYHPYIIQQQWNQGLKKAISLLDVPNVFYFVERGADDINGAMYESAIIGNEYLVKFFVSRGASRWHEGLSHASQGGNMRIVQLFESKGAYNVNDAFVYAAKGGHRNLMDYFIDKGATRIGAAVRETARLHNTEIIEYLVNILSNWSHYPAIEFWGQGMWGAIKGGHMDLFEYFSSRIVDWNTMALNLGVRVAAEKGYLQLCTFFIEKGASLYQGLKGAADGGNISTLKYFMQFQYHELLHDIFFNAGRNGHKEALGLLIEKYDPSTELEKALEGACVGGHADVVQYCLEKGARNYSNALAGAAGGGHRTLVEFFLQNTSMLSDHAYQQALLKAIEGGFFGIVQLLAPQATDWNDALRKAAQCGDLTLVEYCVGKGANEFQKALAVSKLVPCRSLHQYFMEKQAAIEQL